MSALRLLLLLLAISGGVLVGLGWATFDYAEGDSYLSDDPTVCVNCHIMQPQYDSWQKSSHHAWARCVDCHLPPGFVDRYLTKAEHGWNHSKGFTLQDFHEPIRLSATSRRALQKSCLECHADFVHQPSYGVQDAAPDCIRCHAEVGHGPRAGLGGPWRGAELEALGHRLTDLPPGAHRDPSPESDER